MKFDCHVHTTYSDGIKSVFEQAEEAKAVGLGGFALTDHDTIDGWKDISAAEKASDIRIIPGVELSTDWQKRSVHILGYGITNMDLFRGELISLREARSRRIAAMVEKLRTMHMDITFAEVQAKAGEGTMGRPHIAVILAEKGYVKDKQHAFERYINRGKPAYVPRDPFSPMDGISLIKRCGGYAVLAHPGLDRTYEFLDLLCDCGLDGLEAYHSAHYPALSEKFCRLAKERGLAITAGSDDHGYRDEKHGTIGKPSLDESLLPHFMKEYLEEYR